MDVVFKGCSGIKNVRKIKFIKHNLNSLLHKKICVIYMFTSVLFHRKIVNVRLWMIRLDGA